MKTAIDHLLTNYEPHDDLEWSDVECLRDFVSKNPADRIYRNVPGRAAMVASAIVVNPDFSKMLVMHHRVHGFYKQLGGHADGCPDLVDVAAREAQEECGMCGELLSPNPFDFIIWTMIPRMKNGVLYPQHLVLDVAFLFSLADNAKLKLQRKEGIDLKWIPIKEWESMRFDPNNETIKLNPQNSVYNRRIANKIQKFAGR